MLERIRTYLSFIRFSHSVFALPFALAGALLAARGRRHDGPRRRGGRERRLLGRRQRVAPLFPGGHAGQIQALLTSSRDVSKLLADRSTDLVGWEQIGNVATRPEQVGVEDDTAFRWAAKRMTESSR